MKILFFAHDFAGGGAERSLLHIACSLVARGHEVSIAALLKNPAYELPSCIKYIEKDQGQQYADSIKYIFRKIKNRWLRYKTTKTIIENEKPDVIATFLQANTLEILLAHKNIPIVSSERNAFNRELKRRDKYNKLFLNKFFDVVTVLTRYDKAFIGSRLKNVVVIPHALASKPMSKQQYELSFPQRKNLLACGRLSGKTADGRLVKGFDLLIKAFAQISGSIEFDLDIAGDGKQEVLDSLKKLSKECGVENRVHFLGFIKDINHLMESHSVFVLSSREEGFGRVVIEAMSAGCPVVSFDCSGPSEIIVDTIDGLLVESGNIRHLADSILKLATDEELRHQYGERALVDVERFNEKSIIDKWEMMFNSLIKK